MSDIKKLPTHRNSALLAANLTKELLDENLMQRYGTSLDINMGREYQKYLDNKYRLLREEFEKINKDQDDYITMDELTEFINSYSEETGKVYDEDYVKKLFNLIDKNHDEKLTIQEFVESYIKLEEKLRLKKIKLSKLDDELRVTKEKYFKGMNENKDQILNKDGLATDAVLSISLLHAKNLKPMDYNGSSDPYVIFILGDKKATSTYKSATLDPVWNEDFSFQVTNPNLVLEVQVWDNDRFGSDDFEGGVKIPLKELEDQMKMEREFDLELNEEKFGNGTITLRLHYVFSKYKYFSDNYLKTETQLTRLQEDISELNRWFEMFQRPFGILLFGEINNILDRRILERSEDVNAYSATMRKSIYFSPRHDRNTRSLAFKVENVIKGTLKQNNIQWSKLGLIMMYTIVISSFICLIERSDFVGLFLGVAIWTLFIRGGMIDVLEYLKYLLFAILAAIFYDFLWLYLHYKTFWRGMSLDSVENKLKSLTYLFAMVNFLAKIVLGVSLWIQYNKSKMAKKGIAKSPTTETTTNIINPNFNIAIGQDYEA